MSKISLLLLSMSVHMSGAFLAQRYPCMTNMNGGQRQLAGLEPLNRKFIGKHQLVCHTTAHGDRAPTSRLNSQPRPPAVRFLNSMLKLPNLLVLYFTGFSMLFVQNAYALSLSLNPASLSFSLQMKELMGFIFRNEMIFIAITTAYFISLCGRYKNYASWRLPTPLPEAAGKSLSAVAFLHSQL